MHEYYNQLWKYVYSAKVGAHPLRPMTDDQREKFNEIIKEWIRTDEFRVFNFYLEFGNDYDTILKKEYAFNRMEYLEKLENNSQI